MLKLARFLLVLALLCFCLPRPGSSEKACANTVQAEGGAISVDGNIVQLRGCVHNLANPEHFSLKQINVELWKTPASVQCIETKCAYIPHVGMEAPETPSLDHDSFSKAFDPLKHRIYDAASRGVFVILELLSVKSHTDPQRDIMAQVMFWQYAHEHLSAANVLGISIAPGSHDAINLINSVLSSIPHWLVFYDSPTFVSFADNRVIYVLSHRPIPQSAHRQHISHYWEERLFTAQQDGIALTFIEECTASDCPLGIWLASRHITGNYIGGIAAHLTDEQSAKLFDVRDILQVVTKALVPIPTVVVFQCDTDSKKVCEAKQVCISMEDENADYLQDTHQTGRTPQAKSDTIPRTQAKRMSIAGWIGVAALGFIVIAAIPTALLVRKYYYSSRVSTYIPLDAAAMYEPPTGLHLYSS